MNPERLRQVERIFHDALEWNSSERTIRLHRVCAGDSVLQKEVETLIEAHEKRGSFLQSGTYFIGKSFGTYELKSLLGVGGMGRVYRATDSKLKRDVAIKVLPDAFAHNAERLARFRREAEVLASLNHPCLAAIYGLEQFEDSPFLVLELVEGQTLAERLADGAIPIDEAVSIAKQITEALEAAHDNGVIHRDLKPANIKITPQGMVKVLDFGLAKVLKTEGLDLSSMPTKLTESVPGTVMGTVAYMSPEQAKGKEVDRSTDVWAFGCVLYEMLTGRAAFEGETTGDILEAIFKTEPDWNRLPADVPASIRRLLRRCLTKDHRLRLRDVRDARSELTDADNEPENIVRTVQMRTRPHLAWVLTFLLIALFAAVMAVRALRPVPTADEIRFELNLPPSADFEFESVAISPDGRKIVYSAIERRVWHRLTSHPRDDVRPVWSPDGRRIVFASPRSSGGLLDLYWKPVNGLENEELLLATHEIMFPNDWSIDDFLLYDSVGPNKGTSDIWALPLKGDRKPMEVVRTEFNERLAQFAPNGKWIAYESDRSGQPEVYVQPFPGPGSTTVISTSGGGQAHWNPNGKELFYIRPDGRLIAVPIRFDQNSLTIEPGTPSELFASKVEATSYNSHQYMVAPDGDHFIMNSVVVPTAPSPLTVILNWKPSHKPKLMMSNIFLPPGRSSCARDFFIMTFHTRHFAGKQRFPNILVTRLPFRALSVAFQAVSNSIFGSNPSYAVCNRNSTFTASNGKTIRPSFARSRMPACNSAVTSRCTDLTSRPTLRDASRIETGPAPLSTFSNSHRLAVSTFQRSSGVAKLMRADLSILLDFQTRTKSSIDLPGERTSRVTVFTVPPRDIILKFSDWLFRSAERICTLLRRKVPMIALSGFIVVAHNALSIHHVRQPVLELVDRAGHRLLNPPQHQFRECRLRKNDAFLQESNGLHVGKNANNAPVLSTMSTPSTFLKSS